MDLHKEVKRCTNGRSTYGRWTRLVMRELLMRSTTRQKAWEEDEDDLMDVNH